MSEGREPVLPAVLRNHRFALWILLLALTAAILLLRFPLRYEYAVIASVNVLGRLLPLLGVLYYIWLALLLLLLFGSKSGEWQKLALVCLFTLVFFGVFIINIPDGGHPDELMQLGHVKYIQETGSINVVTPNVGYLKFPPFHLLNSTLSQISGLGIFATRTIYLLFASALFAALLYLLFSRLLENPNLASLGVLLAVEGTRMVRIQAFWPGNLSFLLMVFLLVLLAWPEDRALGRTALVALVTVIILAVFAISYEPWPISFVFILVGIYLLQAVAKRSVVNSSTIALLIILLLSWQIYVTRRFSGFAGLLLHLWQGLGNPQERLLWVLQPAGAYLGEATPLWISWTRLFWLALIFGLGGGLGIWNLVKARRLTRAEVVTTGGLVGTAIFGIANMLTFTVEGQWGRFLWLAPLFTIPIMLKFLSSPGINGRLRQIIFAGLVIPVFLLSFPSFLIQRPALSTESVYPYERSAVEFAAAAYGADELDLFSTGEIMVMFSAYLPGSRLHYSPNPEATADREKLWREMNQLMSDFQKSTGRKAIFVLSERFRLPPQHPAAIQPDDPRWLEYVSRLDKNNKIYDNGHIEIYQAE